MCFAGYLNNVIIRTLYICFIIVIWGEQLCKINNYKQIMQGDMVGYWKERSHTYSTDNRSQLENEKKAVWGEFNFI